MKDPNLDILLSEYRQLPVSDLQLQKWKKSVQRELRSQKQKRRAQWTPMVAASIFGFVLGGWVFSNSPSKNHEKISAADATIEYIHIKTP